MMLKSVGWMNGRGLPNNIVGRVCSIRLASGSKSTNPDTSRKADQDKQEGANKPLSGGGYAKRADEEGFGALYGGNQGLSKDDQDKIVHANVPEYDRSKKNH